jgi:hypothetical protein
MRLDEPEEGKPELVALEALIFNAYVESSRLFILFTTPHMCYTYCCMGISPEGFISVCISKRNI